MDGRTLRFILMTILAIVIVASQIDHLNGAIITEKPYYTKADVYVIFPTEDTAKLTIKFSIYGVQANDIEALINKTGEENYTKSIIDNLKRVVGRAPYIGGSYKFYPIKEDVKIVKKILDKEKELKRIDLIYKADLRAREGAPQERGGRRGLIYSTRDDYTNLSLFYALRQLDLLNLTVVLPPAYVISYVRPRPSLLYPVNMSGELRVASSWIIRDPLVDRREHSYTGWFHFGIHNLTVEEVKKIEEIYRKMIELKKANAILADKDKLKEVSRFYDMGYNLLIHSPEKLGYGPDDALKLIREASIQPLSFDANLILPAIALLITAAEVGVYLYFKRKR